MAGLGVGIEPAIFLPYDLTRTPDGEGFLFVDPIEGESLDGDTPRINVVLNWIEELKEPVPVP